MTAADVLAGRAAWAIEHGDALDRLAALPDGSVNCVLSSPPYWGLRSYLSADDPDKARELGLEAVPDCLGWARGAAPCGGCYVCALRAVFAAVRRVLRSDGVLWVVLDDSYVNEPGNGSGSIGERIGGSPPHRAGTSKLGCGLPRKSLVGIPWRVALALQADGWILRCDDVWSQPNALPENVRDRSGRTHEYVFQFARRPTYAYDGDAVREPHAAETAARYAYAFKDRYAEVADAKGYRGPIGGKRGMRLDPRGRVRRSVWSIPVANGAETNKAAFPEELARICILAGCPLGGVVLDPFVGSGTAAVVALRHGRRVIGFDLAGASVALARARVVGDAPMFNGGEAAE